MHYTEVRYSLFYYLLLLVLILKSTQVLRSTLRLLSTAQQILALKEVNKEQNYLCDFMQYMLYNFHLKYVLVATYITKFQSTHTLFKYFSFIWIVSHFIYSLCDMDCLWVNFASFPCFILIVYKWVTCTILITSVRLASTGSYQS